MTLAEKIAELRKQRGWTQALFSEKMGYNSRHVVRWEKGTSRPSVKAVKQMAELFNVNLDELLEGQHPLTQADDELKEKIRQIQQLSSEDRAMIYRMVNVLSTQKQVVALIGSSQNSHSS